LTKEPIARQQLLKKQRAVEAVFPELLFGCGAGIITMLIRLYGAYPEGVCYAILIMNSLSPLIDRCMSRTFKPDSIEVPLVEKITKE
jgi:electron transport complex protein RnfD